MTDDPVDREILELLDRISLRMADFSIVRAEIVALQGRLMELRRGTLYPGEPRVRPLGGGTK